ncbi:hybrid sensor histidine kinase/response regulator [Methylophilus medardicus]|uniref:histidine kinase n=1 Tax=Methylophilus medardicus TaxID=2588534 RepID=A0A5B8CSX9_9PROT|nr:ATP-binding protein [Methylophilus medardicus]QDC44422.1 response regulator [Methylophilus medardicus]QDC49429.1 response regulator [Methylophilus medardicus]QDC53134.1 response regulator [Methylophilus medardicus]
MNRAFNPLQQLTSRMNRLWQDLSLTTKGIVLNALPLTVLLASLALIFESEQQAALLERRVQNALQIQQDIQTLQTLLLEASTGVRDFLLTGNRQFLSGYESAKQSMPNLLNSLEHNLDDQSQQHLLQVIHPLVAKNLDDLAVLASHRQKEADEALIRKFSSQGNALNQLRSHLNKMSLRESAIVNQDKKEVIYERKRNLRITLMAVIAGVVGSLIGVWLFTQTIVTRVKTIRDSANHLVKGEPLALPSISRDELGQLTSELEHASRLLTQSAQEAHLAKVEAEEASAAKSNFLSRTSHELRTPLNAILGFAQILENDLPEGRQKDSAALIHNAGQHLLKLINEVLDISRIESGDIGMSMEVLALNQLLEEAYHYLKPLEKVRDMTIVTQFEDDLFVRADRQRLLQVILNLLANALKYGPDSTKVRFHAYRQQGKVRVDIEDAGKGIPAQLRSRLFTPFDRLGAERTVIEGTGLGLVLSKQLIDAMGGEIGVAEDKSLFWFSLPETLEIAAIRPDTTAQAAVPIIRAAAKSAGKRHVLYVEDNQSNQALIEAMMSKHRHLKLHLAASVQESLVWLRDMQPDLLLLDLNLPDGSGESLIHHIQSSRTQLQQMPIIVLSADALPETIQRLNALGIAHYFTKPINVAAFNQLLLKLLPESPL